MPYFLIYFYFIITVSLYKGHIISYRWFLQSIVDIR